ncbi:MAG: glutathione S-transferase N-terminal domain-containing protein [Burkholderiales bacterium]
MRTSAHRRLRPVSAGAPVIEDDGLILGESAVILDYINTRYGEGTLCATGERPKPGFVHNG